MRLAFITLISISLFGCNKPPQSPGHGNMCMQTCFNALLRANVGGTAEETDTILVNTYRPSGNFTATNLVQSKYYYGEPKFIELQEGLEYEIVRQSDTFRITDVQYDPPRQEYILCGSHCSVSPKSVSVNGAAQKPLISERDIFMFKIN